METKQHEMGERPSSVVNFASFKEVKSFKDYLEILSFKGLILEIKEILMALDKSVLTRDMLVKSQAALKELQRRMSKDSELSAEVLKMGQSLEEKIKTFNGLNLWSSEDLPLSSFTHQRLL